MMDLAQLRSIVARGESDTLEFKKSTGQLQRACETLCAFLNGAGGRVLIGVASNGDIVGQHVSDATQQKISHFLRNFEPPAPITVASVAIDTKKNEVIILTVDSTHETRPFTYNGRPYRRIGTTTSQMPQQAYEQLLLDRMHTRQRWENVMVPEMEADMLDTNEILRTIRVGKENGRLPEDILNDPEDFLSRLPLRKHGELINATIVLFGTQFMLDFPQCELRMARFKGMDKREFLDNRQLRGNIFQLYDEAMLFLDRHIPVSGKIVPEHAERIDTPLFPRDALREALINAFCHRDYSIYGGSVNIAIYDDRLEIASDGSLPFGLTVDQLKRDHFSMLRNPIIADILYRRGLIERWGRGTQNIVKLCVAAGLPEPEYISNGLSLVVRFLRPDYSAPVIVTTELTDRQHAILDLIASFQTVSAKVIKEELQTEVSARMLRYDLHLLKQLGLIDTKGYGRGTVWFLNKKGWEEGSME